MKRRMDKSIIENESDTRIDDLIRKDFDWDIPYNMTHYGL